MHIMAHCSAHIAGFTLKINYIVVYEMWMWDTENMMCQSWHSIFPKLFWKYWGQPHCCHVTLGTTVCYCVAVAHGSYWLSTNSKASSASKKQNEWAHVIWSVNLIRIRKTAWRSEHYIWLCSTHCVEVCQTRTLSSRDPDKAAVVTNQENVFWKCYKM